ncbi:MAG: nucleoside kinase [Deltaproteobacteria bacterium]|nr:nucleoside kinase [Deltaproteobacteria bacterium]MBN2671843.1 nucleoside kinase [Deltaproteobacteria bacterium]
MTQSTESNQEPAKIRYRNHDISVVRGTRVSQLMNDHPSPEDNTVIAAIVNHRLVSLDARIIRSGTIEPVAIRSHRGARLYQRHLTLMLYEVFGRVFTGAKIQIGQAISEGHYFKVSGIQVDDTFVDTLETELKTLSKQKIPFEFLRVTVEEARRMFRQKGQDVKNKLLNQWPSSHVSVVKIGSFVDFCLSPVAPHTGFFNTFKVMKLEDDTFILQFPNQCDDTTKRNEISQPKLYATHKEAKEWSQLMGVAHVAELNSAATSKQIKQVIQISEALHEKKISNIADTVVNDLNRKLVFIAGPSSSGKTTFAKRLSIQLKVLGVEPKSLSLDNYYVDREETPLGEDGKWDFEVLEAIDLERFNGDLRKILDGETVNTPTYNFQTGQRNPADKWIPVQLGPHDVLIIEGIHGLNNALTPAISDKEKFKIYINALNPLAIDEHNRLNTSDVRLIRRIVRDRHYRGYSAAQTINNWYSVRKGERNHIFPFQESADVIFDTSLIYEFSVLKIFAERYLLEVPRENPAFAEAYRLRKFLSMLVTVLPGDIPQTSLMREFIGGSSFSYK